MNDALAQAEALQELLRAGKSEQAPPNVLEALVGCCRELVQIGETQVALDLLESARSAVVDAGEEWAIRAAIVETRALLIGGDPVAALRRCREAMATYADTLKTLPSEHIELRIGEATNLWMLSQIDDSVEKLLAIRGELLGRPDSYLLAWCAFQLSSAELMRGDRTRAREYVLEALVSARRAGSRFVEAMAFSNLDRIERQLCRWRSAEEASTEALKIYQSLGLRPQENGARRGRGLSAWKLGRLESALEEARHCRKEAATRRDELQECFAGILEALVLLHAGDYDETMKCLQPYEGISNPGGQSRPSLLTTEFLGDIHLEQGDADKASAYYEEVWPKAMALVPKGDIVAELRRRRAEVHYLKGNHTAAYDEAKRGLQHCRDLGDRYEEAATYRVLALSAAAVGRADEARRWFDQGFAYYDDIETPFEWGKLWLAYGDWLRGPHAGGFADDQGALEAYHAARDHFARMGASAKLDDANKRIADTMTRKSSAPAVTESAQLELEEDKPKHARRRPRRSSELDTRSDWARESFGLITRHPQMLHILEDVEKLAGSTSPILVLGESGTGKELIAAGIHKLSRRTGAYVPINCSALPREIIESELFGHVAGSFTGATRDKAGLFEVCDSGTVFLDEIATMSLELQSRLLRFLESGESRRIGSNKNVAVSTRIVAATNGERQALEQGDGFRPDLYYRLAHAVVTLPPLRRRGDDADLLIDHFLEQTCREEGKRVRLSGVAWKRLREHPWPGNIRQLRAAIKRVVLLATPGKEVSEADLQLDGGSAPANLLEELEQTEREKIARALAEARGSRTEAARSLGIPRTTFLNKMKRYGLR